MSSDEEKMSKIKREISDIVQNIYFGEKSESLKIWIESGDNSLFDKLEMSKPKGKTVLVVIEPISKHIGTIYAYDKFKELLELKSELQKKFVVYEDTIMTGRDIDRIMPKNKEYQRFFSDKKYYTMFILYANGKQ